jgi:hypothetical protein
MYKKYIPLLTLIYRIGILYTEDEDGNRKMKEPCMRMQPCLCGDYDCEQCYPISRLDHAREEDEARELLNSWNPRPTESGLWFLGEIITHKL